MLDWANPSTDSLVGKQRGGFVVVVSNDKDLLVYQDISLLPDNDYILTYHDKKDSGIPMNIFRIQDFRSDGVHEFIRKDGTWGSLIDEFLDDNTIIEETMRKRTSAFRTNSPHPNHLFYRIQFGYLITSNATPGRTWLDDVTLYESTSVVRKLHVLPVLDGKDCLPERTINLTGGTTGSLDLGVIRKGFRIDKARIRNAHFIFRHEEPEAKCKVLGLYVKSVPEEWAQ